MKLLSQASFVVMILFGCAGPSQEQEPPMDVREFVRQIYVEGVPYEEASRFDSSAVPVLLQMLEDPAEEEYWANIAVTLGIIGDESAVEPLIAFIEKPVEGISRTQYTAKTSALMSLGYLVNKSGNERALNYLIGSLDPEVWEKRGRMAASPFHATPEERNRDLSKYAVLGLALSGRPEAAAALRSLQEPAQTRSMREFQNQYGDVVSEAISTNEKVAQMGLAEYYRASRR
jgi:HEAT repeat protein